MTLNLQYFFQPHQSGQSIESFEKSNKKCIQSSVGNERRRKSNGRMT